MNWHVYVGWKKVNDATIFNKRKEEELGNYKSHFCHWGGDKTNNPGNHCQTCEVQEDD